VILEAWSLHKPVVTSDVPALRELVEGAGGGVTCLRRPAELADALVAVLRDPSRARRLGAAGHRAWARRYTPAAVAARLERVYESVLNEGLKRTSTYFPAKARGDEDCALPAEVKVRSGELERILDETLPPLGKASQGLNEGVRVERMHHDGRIVLSQETRDGRALRAMVEDGDAGTKVGHQLRRQTEPGEKIKSTIELQGQIGDVDVLEISGDVGIATEREHANRIVRSHEPRRESAATAG
jgi:hypothetical protein